MRFLQPSWWRLRGLLRRSYDFRTHAGAAALDRRSSSRSQSEHAAPLAEVGVASEAEARDDLSFETVASADFRQRVGFAASTGCRPIAARICKHSTGTSWHRPPATIR